MNTTNYKYNLPDLYSATNNGLDIIHKLIPNSVGSEKSSGATFIAPELRDEKNASCSLYNNKGIWHLKDFAGENYSPIDVAVKFSGLDFAKAIQKLYSDHNLEGASTFTAAEIEFKENNKEFTEGYFKATTKIEYKNLERFGRFVTPKIATLYNIHEIESYVRVTKASKEKTSKIITTTATETYPIFFYSDDLTKWAKTYQPAEYKRKDKTGKEKNFKHGYLGTKPENYVHGLERILDSVDEDRISRLLDELDTLYKNDGSKHKIEALQKQIKEEQVPNIIICTGGSDGVNVASLSNNYYPIWFNSESEQISYSLYQRLNKLCVNFYNLPDTDVAGKNYANTTANKYWNLKTIQLPKSKLGEKGKDFRDWLKYYKKSDKQLIVALFERLLKQALKCNFIGKNDQGRPRINLSDFHYFLNSNNYYSYKEKLQSEDKSNEDKNFVIKVDDYIVSIPEVSEIKQFTIDYCLDKGVALPVIDLIKRSRVFTPSELKGLERIDLDFKNYTSSSQYYYFNNGVATITPEGVKFSSQKIANRSVWSHKVVPRNFRVTSDFFTHYTDNKGNDRVRFTEGKSCDFMNYLINGSRVYWKKETGVKQQKQSFSKENLFNLEGEGLTYDEHVIHNKHFLNKCYAIGYLLSGYKLEDLAKFILIMDDTVKDTAEEANGGTGKSLLVRALEELLRVFYIDGKKPNIEKDNHLFGGLQLDHDIITLEDGGINLGFEFFYNKTTGKIDVNPKGKQGHSIPFADAPKIVGTFNYGLNKINGSTARRIFYVSYSDYYHSITKEFDYERKVSDDFGYNFFQNWDNEQYNDFYNFLMQCCAFYLKNVKDKKEFKAPMENINANNLKSQIGDNFSEWANGYFLGNENFNVKIRRKEMHDNYRSKGGKQGAKKFKTSLELYCKLKGYVFNPKELCNTNGRISQTVTLNVPGDVGEAPKTKRTTIEMFFIENKTIASNEKENSAEAPSLTSDIDF